MIGAGIGGGLGASLAAAAHGAKYLQRRRTYNVFRPFAKALGPEVSSLYAKHFKPRFLSPALGKHMGAAGLSGAAPMALIAALT